MIVRISADDTIDIRHKILRPNMERSTCLYPGDEDSGTFHLGKYVDNELVSIASFYKQISPHADFKNCYRLRGMATLPEHRSKGFGSALIDRAKEVLKLNGVEYLWCNAREVAFCYYEKLNFEFASEMFDIEGIGPHKVMAIKIAED